MTGSRTSPIRHPATIALIVILVGSLASLQLVTAAMNAGQLALNSTRNTGTEDVEQVYLWFNLGYVAMQMLGVVAAASAMALVLVWCFAPGRRQSSDGTRTMSAAGSTVNRADTMVPNSSPSISNSSDPSTISMSTERPRE